MSRVTPLYRYFLREAVYAVLMVGSGILIGFIPGRWDDLEESEGSDEPPVCVGEANHPPTETP